MRLPKRIPIPWYFRCDGGCADGTDNEDVIIKISDQGEVLRGVKLTRFASYLFTTADPRFKEAFIGERITVTSLRLRGLVTGCHFKLLPISLEVIWMSLAWKDMEPMPFKRLGDTKEPIPV
jgi:hypothetical protein